ncbi:hypothetical protein C0J52_00392 [Blattella germanica]|nr:hypothetical protein C0J52_00392 [Blattella germanica]
MEMGFREMKMLTELIKPKEDSESDEEDLKQTGLRKMEEDRNNIDFNVTKDTLQIRSPRYYLSLGLPHHVDPEKCKVEWDRPLLKIKLRLQREYDFVNF